MATDDDTLHNIGKAGEFPQRFAHMHDGEKVELEPDLSEEPAPDGTAPYRCPVCGDTTVRGVVSAPF